MMGREKCRYRVVSGKLVVCFSVAVRGVGFIPIEGLVHSYENQGERRNVLLLAVSDF